LGDAGELGGFPEAVEDGGDLPLALVRPGFVLHDGHGRTSARAALDILVIFIRMPLVRLWHPLYIYLIPERSVASSQKGTLLDTSRQYPAWRSKAGRAQELNADHY
jgi:hypothetical protein